MQFCTLRLQDTLGIDQWRAETEIFRKSRPRYSRMYVENDTFSHHIQVATYRSVVYLLKMVLKVLIDFMTWSIQYPSTIRVYVSLSMRCHTIKSEH